MLILTKTADIASLPPGELYRHIHRSVDQLLSQFEPGEFTLEAVSYTHLDVYKRQRWC